MSKTVFVPFRALSYLGAVLSLTTAELNTKCFASTTQDFFLSSKAGEIEDLLKKCQDSPLEELPCDIDPKFMDPRLQYGPKWEEKIPDSKVRLQKLKKFVSNCRKRIRETDNDLINVDIYESLWICVLWPTGHPGIFVPEHFYTRNT
jgi:hypothetical protein